MKEADRKGSRAFALRKVGIIRVMISLQIRKIRMPDMGAGQKH